MPHLSATELEAGLEGIREAPADGGALKLIARRPEVEERELLDSGEFTVEGGLVGDCWPVRQSSRGPDGGPNPEAQVTLMGSRAAALVAGSPEHADWAWAGDQLYVDLDLSHENLPAGTRLEVGDAVLEITAEPHLGCGKFSKRFGVDALKFVNSEVGRELRLRGVNARVVQPGRVAIGDPVRKQH